MGSTCLGYHPVSAEFMVFFVGLSPPPQESKQNDRILKNKSQPPEKWLTNPTCDLPGMDSFRSLNPKREPDILNFGSGYWKHPRTAD